MTSIPANTIGLVVLGLLTAGVSHATHKSWLLKHSGSQCVVQYPASDNIGYPGIIENTRPYGVYVSCPVILAGRSGSSDNGVTAKSWVAAKQARIFFREVRSPFWCQARAEDAFGNVYYGATNHWSPGDGLQVLDLINDEDDWGGTLELEEPNYIRQLDFECRIGSGSPSAPAQLFGYDIAICQTSRSCEIVRSDRPGGESTVQGSGIECGPSTAGGGQFLRRGPFGITNDGDEVYSTHCPITQPADDSYEHRRQVYSLQLAYSGRAPTCRLESYDASGVVSRSDVLEPDSFLPRTLRLRSSFSSGTEKSLALQCNLPPGSAVEGYTARMSVTRKSAGI